jgi:two-component system chemotaxis response regulator CheB
MTVSPSFRIENFDLIAIGCSAGGFDALLSLLPALPASLAASVIVVIHLSPESRSEMPSVFSSKCRIPVKEAEDKEPIAPGTLYFAPPGYHLLVETDHTFSLSSEEAVNYSRPSIDVLFESAAIAYRDRLLGILLTGASSDGALGTQAVHSLHGTTFVQDPVDARHPLMPQSALNLGPPDALPSLADLRLFFEGDRNG